MKFGTELHFEVKLAKYKETGYSNLKRKITKLEIDKPQFDALPDG